MANQVLTKSQTPALDFADVTGALEYWVQIATDPRFVTITEQKTGLATSTMTPSNNLTTGKKYFWRFRTRTSAAYTTDQSETTASGSGNALRDAAARTGLGQGFKPTRSLPVARVTLKLKRTGSPGSNVWVEIWSGASSPTAQVGTDSATVTTASIGTGVFETVTFDFATPVPVVSGTQYYIVLQGDYAVGAAYVEWEHSGSNSYADGGPWKHDGSVAWTTDGTSDQLFTAQVQSWSAWSAAWSFWVDTTAEAAVTPTALTLVDPDVTTDAYTFDMAPKVRIIPEHIRRAHERNLAGALLTEYVTTMATIELDFSEANMSATQAAEFLRFYEMRKAIYLIVVIYNEQDTVETIYKCEFEEDPAFEQLANGRYDRLTGTIKLVEASYT